ncbi:EpsG family protein [Chryseobacterium caseinilyticum]|uniref:EpsG family protein n=1 Tax=Chryseobacterium caseinilyticum TaxID=2771428 RepID=A0ABR8ZAQ9_9FLAO|nr:EpsG family protein [Chryseobacterium caseinilyticum]MBD8082320.1 EpsG family protein [Chryseobacterium caseinilyticum]
MYFYYFTILLLFIPALIETSYPRLRGEIPYKKIILGFVVLVLVGQMGLRWEMATDWKPYFYHFTKKNTTEVFSYIDYDYEKAYVILVYLCKKIANHYSFFLVVHAAIFFLLLKKSFEFFSPFPILVMLLFYVSFLGVWGANRQFLAVAFGLLSLIYLYEKRWLWFVIMLFMATQFHVTSIILVIFVFLQKKISNLMIIVILAASFIIGYTSLPVKVFSLFGGFSEAAAFKANAYLKEAKFTKAEVSTFGLIKRLLFFSLFFIYRNKISEMFPKYNFLFNGYFVGMCFYFLFSKSLLVMISRGSLYFNIFEPILISCLFLLVKDRRVLFFMALGLFAYCIIFVKQSVISYPELFDPYRGILFNPKVFRIL